MANSWTFIFEQSAIIIITQGSEYHGVDFDFFVAEEDTCCGI